MYLEKVVPEDKEEIRLLSAGIWEGNDYIPKVFDRWVKGDGFYKYVLDHKIIGVCKYTRQPGGILWLEGLRIHKNSQNRGYGSEVASLFHKLLLKTEHTALRFMTDATNSKSIHLAEKRGFDLLLEMYHLEYEGGPVDPPPEVSQETEVASVKDIVFSSEEYTAYKGLYIKNWTAYDLTADLLAREVKSANCFSVREGDISGVVFLNRHERYRRVSIPFIAGKEDAVEKLIRFAIWCSGEDDKGLLLLKTPMDEVKSAGERLGMKLADFRKVLVFERINE